jgi:hypothetical protein
MLTFWYWAFDEYCLQPVINRTLIATPALEFIFMFLSLSMHPDNTFTKSNKSVSHFSIHAPLAAHAVYWDTQSPLEAIKNKLYQFFESAF